MTGPRFARLLAGVAASALLLATPDAAAGQDPAPPPQAPPPPPVKAWTQTLSGGLALTNGNRDTSTINLGYEVIYDPQRRNLAKSDGLFLRGKTNGQLSAERLGINMRDEYRIADGAFVFGQLQYLRDRFKEIDYLIWPTTGLGYRVVDNPGTRISLDAGLGGVWEKDFNRPLRKSGAITIAEKLAHQLSTTATVTQSASVLIKTNDLTDSLYVLSVTISATITTRTQLKVEAIDTYKTRLAPPSIVHNDVALVVAFVYKR